jgi:hypothetical protein
MLEYGELLHSILRKELLESLYARRVISDLDGFWEWPSCADATQQVFNNVADKFLEEIK